MYVNNCFRRKMNKDEIILMKAFGINTYINEMLIVATAEDDIQEAKRLLEAGADVDNIWNSNLGSILKKAIKENDVELFYRITEYVTEINIRSQIAELVRDWND